MIRSDAGASLGQRQKTCLPTRDTGGTGSSKNIPLSNLGELLWSLNPACGDFVAVPPLTRNCSCLLQFRRQQSACNAGDLGSTPGLGRSLEKEMATHSSTLAWKIPRTEELGRLQSRGLQSETRLSDFTSPTIP